MAFCISGETITDNWKMRVWHFSPKAKAWESELRRQIQNHTCNEHAGSNHTALGLFLVMMVVMSSFSAAPSLSLFMWLPNFWQKRCHLPTKSLNTKSSPVSAFAWFSVGFLAQIAKGYCLRFSLAQKLTTIAFWKFFQNKKMLQGCHTSAVDTTEDHHEIRATDYHTIICIYQMSFFMSQVSV